MTSVAVGKSGQRVYSGGSDGMVSELDSNSGQVLSKFKAAKIPISCVAVSPGQFAFFSQGWAGIRLLLLVVLQ